MFFSTPLHILIASGWNSDHSTEYFQDTVRVLIEQGRQDPMAVDKYCFTPLHIYSGILQTVDYIINQQNHCYVDLAQREESGLNVVDCMLITNALRSPLTGLQLVRYCWEILQTRRYESWTLTFLLTLRHFSAEVPSDTKLSIPDLVGMDDMVNWLAGLVAIVHRHERCKYLPTMLSYHCVEDQSPTDFNENSKTLLIRLWLAVLQEANIDLHEHLQDMEETLDQHRILDAWHYREGIKRELEVKYGSDPDDVTILVRDVRVDIPPEDCIPGAWSTGETYFNTGLIAKAWNLPRIGGSRRKRIGMRDLPFTGFSVVHRFENVRF